jgi:hypothetical protein
MYSEGEYALAGFSVGVVLPRRADLLSNLNWANLNWESDVSRYVVFSAEL